eukprot:TRINITY_DN350_c0_g2_i1.p1 TRINITY_DN350_c0_g2~~TRINITY_DN350_c0_g2_i1.p1  ORF type:complete len:367 (+),score=106.97 TRINITY_DN350_c0_g2_i1:93-1193(+)
MPEPATATVVLRYKDGQDWKKVDVPRAMFTKKSLKSSRTISKGYVELCKHEIEVTGRSMGCNNHSCTKAHPAPGCFSKLRMMLSTASAERPPLVSPSPPSGRLTGETGLDTAVPAWSLSEEMRIDTEDGSAYPKQSFIDVYGETEGLRRWEHSALAPAFDRDSDMVTVPMDADQCIDSDSASVGSATLPGHGDAFRDDVDGLWSEDLVAALDRREQAQDGASPPPMPQLQVQECLTLALQVQEGAPLPAPALPVEGLQAHRLHYMPPLRDDALSADGEDLVRALELSSGDWVDSLRRHLLSTMVGDARADFIIDLLYDTLGAKTRREVYGLFHPPCGGKFAPWAAAYLGHLRTMEIHKVRRWSELP